MFSPLPPPPISSFCSYRLFQVLCSSVVFFMPYSTYDALGYRMETSVSLILASVSTKYIISSELPKVNYNTLCDK